MKNFLKEIKRLQAQEKRLQQIAQKNPKIKSSLEPTTPIAKEWPDISVDFIWGVVPEIPDHLSPKDVPNANYFHFWSEDYDEVQEFVAAYGGMIIPLSRSPEYSENWQLGFPSDYSDDFEDEEEY